MSEEQERLVAVSLVGSLMMMGIALGPVVGGLVASLCHWRVPFLALSLAWALMALFAVLWLHETAAGSKGGNYWQNVKRVFCDRHLVTILLTEILVLSTYYSFNANVSYLTEGVYGMSTVSTSWMMGAFSLISAIGMIIVTNSKSPVLSTARLWMTLFSLGAGGSFVVAALFYQDDLWSYMGSSFLMGFFLACYMPLSVLYLERVEDIAGTAASFEDKIALPDAHDPVTGHGRWLYEGRLGEGGLATVFRAWDCKGGLGFVAVKVLKKHSKAHARHAFAMHRESQWSLERLHNRADPRYSEEHAKLFARYLEDHTGFVELGPEDFEERRKDFESPSFDWYKQRIDLPIASKPYVVMELVKGETLQVAMPSMSATEKRQVILQCATALEYLERFHMIHRDFRGCNMHLIAREKPNESCQLKILDLGVMISSEAGMEVNCNMAVQAFRRRGETEEKRKRYDWLPWEVRSACDELQGAVKNFEPPGAGHRRCPEGPHTPGGSAAVRAIEVQNEVLPGR
eukprot:g2933.t1